MDDDPKNNSMFITSVNNSSSKQITKNWNEKIHNLYGKLNGIIGNLDARLQNVVSKQECDYLKACKLCIAQKNKDIIRLQQKANSMIPTQAEVDEKLKSMKDLIDFLDQRLREKEDERLNLELEYNKLKSKLDNTSMDNAFLEKKLKEKIKENAMLKEIIANVRESDHNIQDKKLLDALDIVSENKIVSDRNSPSNNKKSKKHSNQNSLENLLENYEETPIFKKKVSSMIEQIKSKCSQSIEIMKFKLAKEKTKAIKLKAKEPLREREKSELENLFLECIEEQKKQIEKRKMVARLSAQKKGWRKDSVPSDDFIKTKMREISIGKLQFVDLTPPDKLMIFEKFILQPNVLTVIYNKMFEDKSALKLGSSLIHPIS